MSTHLLAKLFNPAINSTLGNQTGANFAVGGQTLIRNLVDLSMGLGGLYFFINLLRGGYEYITAGGEKDKIHNAYERIKNSLTGVIVVLTSFAILYIIETVFGFSIRNFNIPNL